MFWISPAIFASASFTSLRISSKITPSHAEKRNPVIKIEIVTNSIEVFLLCFFIGVPIKIRNDAKCAALAEKKYGALKNYKDCIFLCIGTGIGGAAFLNGKMLEPNGFSGFEFGHIIIEKDGRECTCGKKGCFEQYASISAVKKKVTKILGERPDVSGRYLREELLVKDNTLVKLEVENWLNYLKIGIGNLIDIFEPKAICLGGSFSHYEGNPILDRLINKLQEPDTTFTISKKPDIVLAKYKNDSGIIGATL